MSDETSYDLHDDFRCRRRRGDLRLRQERTGGRGLQSDARRA